MADPALPRTRWASPRLIWLAAMIALAAIAVALARLIPAPPPALEVGRAAPSAQIAQPARVLPPPPQTLSPLELAPLTRDQARARNAAVPLADTDPPPARAFAFNGTPADRARAVDCLAIAAMAEAGASDDGQRAVIQVVLNRVRHPAFVPTVCGAVFQGSERATGCQFTFTCDGSLGRIYSDSAWAAARVRAQEALGGRVYALVGLATHYHTDWVYPYWSSDLDKVARVDTHLFFRWRGFWGTPAAARVPYAGREPAIGALAMLPAHAPSAEEAAQMLADGEADPLAAAGGASDVVVRHPDSAAFFIQLTAANAPAALARGRELCGGVQPCRVMGWTDRAAIPSGYPLPSPARAALAFSYVREAGQGEIVFYDCRLFADVPQDSCLPRSLRG